MKLNILAGLLIATVAVSANAGVAEKKAIRIADKNISEEVVKTKAACGNKNLEVAVSWAGVKDMIKSNAELIKSKRYETRFVILQTGERTVSTLEAMASICTGDADYKEELAKLTKLVVNAKPDFGDYKSAFSLEGQVITASSGHYATRKSSDFVERIKALY